MQRLVTKGVKIGSWVIEWVEIVRLVIERKKLKGGMIESTKIG